MWDPVMKINNMLNVKDAQLFPVCGDIEEDRINFLDPFYATVLDLG